MAHIKISNEKTNIVYDYIPKSRIRDKIKTLEEYFDGNKENTPTSTNQFIIDSVAINVSISLLKELLEEN